MTTSGIRKSGRNESWLLTRMSSHKQPHDKTIESGCLILGILKSLLIVYYCRNNVADCTLLAIVACSVIRSKCSSRNHKFREVYRFMKVFTYTNQTLSVVAYESLKTKEKSGWVIPKVVAVAYGSGHLRELFIKEFE